MYDLKWPRDIHTQVKDELLHAFRVPLTTCNQCCVLGYRPGIARCAHRTNDDQIPNASQTHLFDRKFREIFSPQLVKDKLYDFAVTQ